MIIRQENMLSDNVPLDKDVVMVHSPAWEEALKEFKDAPVFCLDMETYGEGEDKKGKSNSLNPRNGFIRLIQVGLLSGKVLVANLGGWFDDRQDFARKHKAFTDILVKKAMGPSIKIGANLKFECGWLLQHYGVSLRNIRDLMLMSQVYWAGVKHYRHGLKYVLERLGEYADKTEQKSDWGVTLTNSQINYAARDVKLFDAAKKMKAMLQEEDLWESAMIENNACPAFAEMEYRGIPVREDILIERIKSYTSVALNALTPFTQAFPGVNPASPKQLLEALNERFDLGLQAPPPNVSKAEKKTEAKQRSTANAKKMAECPDPAVKGLLLYRSILTQVHYLKKIKHLLIKGRIHPDFYQVAENSEEEGMGMGRTSSKNPNVQNPSNLPKPWAALGLLPVRDIFQAPPGYKFIVSDLSQAHMRIAAEASQDRVLVDAYNHGWDLHAITASQLARIKGLGEDWTHENITIWNQDKSHPNNKLAAALRKVSKTVNYAGLNGSGAQTIMNSAASNKKDPISAPLEEWQATVQAFKETYSGLERFKRNEFDKANHHNYEFGRFFGCIRGLSGRRLFVEKYPSKQGYLSKYTDTVSHIWMSTEAEIGKGALADWLALRDKHGWDAYLINFPHDEINVIAHETCADDAAKALMSCMDDRMARYIKTIPVNEPDADYKSCVKNSWADK